MTTDDSGIAAPEGVNDDERVGTSKRRFRFTIKIILFIAVIYFVCHSVDSGFSLGA